MPLNITARAVTKDEVLDMGDGGAIVGADGEVLLQLSDENRTYRFILDGDGSRSLGKALISEGWEALARKHGAPAAIRRMFKQGKSA